jgi:hypothetical protein
MQYLVLNNAIYMEKYRKNYSESACLNLKFITFAALIVKTISNGGM